MKNLPPASIRVPTMTFSGSATAGDDLVTVEEPLEIRVRSGPAGKRVSQSLSVTMRTPGDDEELALGFLMGEAIVTDWADVASVGAVGAPSLDKGLVNVVEVALTEDLPLELTRLSRHTYTTSSCGVCGKATLEAVAPLIPDTPAGRFSITPDVVKTLHDTIAGQQIEFARTGGLHAAALFDEAGIIERIREDVGRHNAVDKLLGSYLEEGLAVLQRRGVLVSGRLSFELVQKAALAGIPLMAAIGPPSSLAIELADTCGMTLVGFLRPDRFNLYCGDAVVT